MLAVATRKVEKQAAYQKLTSATLTAYLAFFDPPKDTAATAIKVLRYTVLPSKS